LDEITFDAAFKRTLVGRELLVLELKSVEKLEPVHFKQFSTYLRLTGLRLELLINFGGRSEECHLLETFASLRLGVRF
jgi:GxxExxY protein